MASKIDSIDILINNAGIDSEQRILQDNTIDFEVNVFGTLNVCCAFSDKITKEGAIINVCPLFWHWRILLSRGIHSASKSTLHSATQALRAEFALRDVEVYEVLPGPIETGMSENQPMEKASPEDVAKEVWAGYEAKTFEIYPDPVAKG